MSSYESLDDGVDKNGADKNSMSTDQEVNAINQVDVNSSTGLYWSDQEKRLVENTFPGAPDLVCLSHLRWDFVYQRPQHLLSRCTQERRVFFIEEPIVEPIDSWWFEISQRECGVWVVVPHLPDLVNEELAIAMQQSLVDELFAEYAIDNPILWYYTPMALSFTNHLRPSAVIYDCMDELSAFRGASPLLKQLEKQLFDQADVVFTGGQSLYEAKQHQHANVHAFPSSIDVAHFGQARKIENDPDDQSDIPHPRLGFFGVIDERMDLNLLDEVAQARPDWHLVVIGPVAKIAPENLPRHANIHYLGNKSYQELPHYIAGWDVALLPFAHNESTRFISPTKTPEYLAAGKPVVSTSIRDVVRPYGEQGLVQIADTSADFVAAIATALQQNQDASWLQRVDEFLATTSWDQTWQGMNELIDSAIAERSQRDSLSTATNHEQTQSSQSSIDTNLMQFTARSSHV